MENISRLKEIFQKAVELKASDVHILANEAPVFRIDGKLSKHDGGVLSAKESEDLISLTLRPEYIERLKVEKEVDFSFNFESARVRANVYFESGAVAGSYRFIPADILSFEDLGLPPIMQEFANREQGLLIITGPTGHGKSTTIAALIEYINQSKMKHIVTIEDPTEYIFKNSKSIISQREFGTDTLSFTRALRSALREDPDVVFVGEMRDLETFEAVLTIAETGHLIFTTLHTNSAAQTPKRIIDVFPKSQQDQVRQQLSNVISGVISQRLIPKASGKGRVLACEILVANSAVRNLIREDKIHQIQSTIQTSASEGMITLDKVLADFVSRGEITLEEALKWSDDPKQFKQMVF
ncbi:MAG: type IV pilus twitching motility protein PilT [Candidatus Berkelbacteria bacterium]|nr:type IV pilus twitching motility protein PilT [Candidatus Berkelbacteria bacterium]